MQLPRNTIWQQASTIWAAILNPLIANPQNNARLLTGIKLVTGVNIVNHGLGRMQQGWELTDIQGPAVIYRSAAFNDLTLTLTSSADVAVSIGVF